MRVTVMYVYLSPRSIVVSFIVIFVYVRTLEQLHRSRRASPPKFEPAIRKRQLMGHCGDLDPNTGSWADNVDDVELVEVTDKSHTMCDLVNSK